MIGCIDGTYINVQTPAHKIKSTYTNRHDIPSITLQGICNANKKFIDVFTGVPGKIHDSRVFSMSFISEKIRTLTNNGYYHLLGDSAYTLREWLITPYRDYGNLTRQQKNHNKKFSATRVKIENTFGLLKSRFRQLQRLEFQAVLKSAKFIVACCTLHNLCIDYNDVIDLEDVFNEDANNNAGGDFDHDIELRRAGEIKRDRICAFLQA